MLMINRARANTAPDEEEDIRELVVRIQQADVAREEGTTHMVFQQFLARHGSWKERGEIDESKASMREQRAVGQVKGYNTGEGGTF